jgi:hypothetical protein
MQCPRCANPIGNGAAFCPHCGQFMAAAAQGGMAVPMASARRQTTLWAVVGTIAAVLAIALGLKAAGLLQFGSRNPDNRSLAAAGAAAPDTLGLRGAGPKPILQDQGKNPPGMPDDVRRYLEHVERIEHKKIDLASRMIAEMEVFKAKLGTFGGAEGLMNHDEDLGGDGAKPDKETTQTFGDVKGRWDALVEEFKSMPPPQPCVGLRDDYYRALSEIPGFAGDLADVLQSIQTDPASALQKVEKMKGSSEGAIDKYFGAADGDLGDICSHYNTTKWFEIKRDVGGGSLAMPGL